MKGCLIAIAVVFVLVVGGGVLVWMNKDVIVTGVKEKFKQPDYGKKEYIVKHYGKLLRSIDGAAHNATSIMTFGAAVEGLNLPEEVLYVGINKGKDKTPIIKRFEWSGISTLIMFGYGSGTLHKSGVRKNIIIYSNEGPWDYMDSFDVYIEYTGAAKEGP